MKRLGLCLPAIALLALLPAGCGRLGPDEDTPLRVVREQRPVTAEQIDRYPSGSPEAVVLEWWRALQRGDAATAVRLYSRKVDLSRDEFGIQRSLGRRYLGMFHRISVRDVDRGDDETTVFLFREKVSRAPNGRTDVTSSARGYTLVRERGRWVLADNLFLERAAGIGLAVQARALSGQG